MVTALMKPYIQLLFSVPSMCSTNESLCTNYHHSWLWYTHCHVHCPLGCIISGEDLNILYLFGDLPLQKNPMGFYESPWGIMGLSHCAMKSHGFSMTCNGFTWFTTGHECGMGQHGLTMAMLSPWCSISMWAKTCLLQRRQHWNTGCVLLLLWCEGNSISMDFFTYFVLIQVTFTTHDYFCCFSLFFLSNNLQYRRIHTTTNFITEVYYYE